MQLDHELGCHCHWSAQEHAAVEHELEVWHDGRAPLCSGSHQVVAAAAAAAAAAADAAAEAAEASEAAGVAPELPCQC